MRINIRLYLVTMLAFTCSMLSLMAQEDTSNVIFENPYLSLAVTIATGLIALAVPVMRKFMRRYLEEEAVEAISVSITKVYSDWVRDAKRAAGDNKLTEQEKKTALDNALTNAKEIARGPVKKLLQKKGRDWGISIIERIISKFKSGK